MPHHDEHEHQGQVNIGFPKGVHLTPEQKAELKKEFHAAITGVLNKHAATTGKNVSVDTSIDKNGLF